ncbi:unnamed protein product [Trichobilharzia szidati]|nr:unnamed protein product [Trichobilharzia szidati]
MQVQLQPQSIDRLLLLLLQLLLLLMIRVNQIKRVLLAEVKLTLLHSSSSGNEIWLILSANRLKFIQDLVKQKEYELAICLARTGLYAGQNAVETLQITNLYAIHLYHEMKFTEALNLFTELLINPKHVLTLFPGILSEQQLKRQQQEQGQIADYPCEISIMNSAQMTDAFEPLITYLLTWRRLLKQQLNKTPLKQSKLLNNITEAKEEGGEGEDSSQLSLSSRSGQQHQAKAYNNNNVIEFHCYSIKDVSKMILPCIELLELIDTSLLKCYLSTNTARVAPLLRQENVCMLEESVKTLLEHKRYQELVMLYQSRGLHREALSILQQFSTARMKHHRTGGGGGGLLVTTTTTTDASSPVNMITLDDKLHKSGLIQQLGHPKRILHYFLQYLNASHIDLLIDYTKWLMLHYPTSWMRILSNWEAKLTAKYQSQFSSNTASSSSSSIDAVKRDEFIAFCSNYRNQILQYMEQYAPHLIIPYLELIIFVHWNSRHSSGDDDEDEDDEEEVEAEEEEVDDEDDDVEEDDVGVEEDEKIGNNDGVGDSSRDDDSNERLEPGDNSCIMNSTDDSIENKINNGDAAAADAEELLHKQKSKPISIVQQSEHHGSVGKHNVSKKIIEHASNKSSPANNILGCRVASLSQLSCNSMDSTQSGYMSPGKRSSVFKEMISSSLWPLPSVKRSKQRRLTTSTMNSLSKVDNSTVNTNDLDALPSIPNYPAYMDVCDIHTRYAMALIRRAQSLQPANKSFAFKVNEEQPKSGSVARLRLRLLRFLMHPGTQYSSARLLDKCPYDAFFEERALLLANLNKHEQALSLWVHVLDDWNRAVNHCINVYQRSELSSICKNNQNNNSNNNDNDTKRGGGGGAGGGVDTVNTDYPNNSHSSSHHGAINSSDKHSNSSSSLNRHNSLNSLDNSSLLDLNNNNNHNNSNTNHETLNTDNHHHPFYDYCNNSNIFFLLIQICLQPTEPTSLGIVLPSSVKFTPKLNKALEILHQFSSFIDPVKVIRIMPTVTLNSVGDYLKSMFISQESTLTQLVFLQNASKAELIASCTDRIKSTSDHLSILPSTRCRTCRRRIGNSAFVKQPRNANHSELEHYGCCKDLIFKNT